MTQQNSLEKFNAGEMIFRPAIASELKLAALRLLHFDEPVSAFARLKKTVQKQLNKSIRDVVKTRSIYEIAALHGRIFGACPAIDAANFYRSIIFSLALVLEDFRLYAPAAFNAFTQEVSDIIETSDLRVEKIWQIATSISQLLHLSRGQKQWLIFSLLAAPDWQKAWQSDVRGEEFTAYENLGKEIFDRIVPFSEANAQSFEDGVTIDRIFAAAQKCGREMQGQLRPFLVLLVEGQSEAIVLPHFARLIGKPFEDSGVLVIASGGSQQVVRRYLTMKDVLQIPLVCLFDGDAWESSTIIEEDLREIDHLIALQATELEDCYSYEQVLKILNYMLVRQGQTLSSEPFTIPKISPRKQSLNKLFRGRGLGDFDKIAFARATVALLDSASDVPTELRRLLEDIPAFIVDGGGRP